MNRTLLRAVTPLLVGICLLMSASALQFSLLALRADGEVFAHWVVPVMSSGYFVAFLAGSWLAPRWIDSVGHVRTFSAMASLASVVILVHAFWVVPVVWVAARVASGICIAAMVTTVESWLNAAADSSTRGAALSWYMVVMQFGFVAGPLLVAVGDPAGFGLFALVSILLSLSLVPMLLGGTDGAVIDARHRLDLGELARRAPVGIAASFAGGFGWSIVASMLIVVGLREGFSAEQAASIGVAGVVGSMLSQVPIGRWSDRVDRRIVIAVTGLATGAVGAAAIALVTSDQLWVHWVVAGLLGAAALPAYGLGIAHVGDVVEPGNVVGAAATLVAVSAVGSAVGPLATAMALSMFGTIGVPIVFAAAGTLLGGFSLWRLGVRPTRTPRAHFVALGARATGVGTTMVADELVDQIDDRVVDAPV